MRKNSAKHFTSSVLLIVIFLSINLSLKAQEVQDSSILKTHKRLPILNNFRFIPSDIVKDPFINTFVKLNAGSGTALDLKTYVKNLQGEVFDTLSGNISYLSGELNFSTL